MGMAICCSRTTHLVGERERSRDHVGEPRAGVHCPRSVFAQPFGHRRVAVVQVEDRAGSASGALPRFGFHFMVLQQLAYCDLGGDPFNDRLRFIEWNGPPNMSEQ